jgi:hypothetical protein
MDKCRYCLALTVFVLCGPLLAAADEHPAVKALMAQGERLTRREDALAKASPKAAVLLRLLERDVRTLGARIRETPPPQEFVFSLRRDTSLLVRVNTETPTPKDIARLRRALASIDLKVHNLQKREGKFVLTWAEGLLREPGRQKAVFESLASNLDKVKVRVRAFEEFDDDVRPLFEGAQQDLRYLTELSNKHDVPGAYLLSLTEDAHLLALASKEQTPTLVAAVYFRDSAEDLHVKAASSHAGQKKKSPFQEVETRVETRDPDDDNKPKKGYEVWYVPKGLANDRRYWRRFRPFSTPAVENRVPGCYEMWTKKQMKEGEEAEVDVKDDGKGLCPVDLWIPK